MKTAIPTALLVSGLISTSVHGQTPSQPTIESPVNNARLTSDQVTITGRTTPDSGVTLVQYSIDGQAPVTATQLNSDNWNNWEATAGLTPGSNQFRVWATGAGGSSPTNSANYYLVLTSVITIKTNGDGFVLNDLNGEKLVIGNPYTIFAVPGAGHLFAGWTGSLASTDPVLTFLMESNLQLTANFVASPFTSNNLPGAYGGLFWDTASPSETNVGRLTLTLDRDGVFSGQVSVDGGLFMFHSVFGPNGEANLTVQRHNKADLSIVLSVDLTGVNGLTGTISGNGTNGVAAFSSSLQAYREFANTAHRGKSVAGNYTLAVSGAGSGDPAAAPQGFSYGTASTDASGLVNLSLFFSDGTTAIASGNLVQNASTNASLPFYVSLNGGAGSMVGWVLFTNGAPTTNYQIFWFKDPVARGAYTNGFSLTERTLWLDPFRAPSHGDNVLGASNALVQLTGGDLTEELTNAVTLNATGAASGANTPDMMVSVKNNSGLFSGSFVDPVDGQTVQFQGAVLEAIQQGLGYFRGSNQLSGAVGIVAAPAP